MKAKAVSEAPEVWRELEVSLNTLVPSVKFDEVKDEYKTHYFSSSPTNFLQRTEHQEDMTDKDLYFNVETPCHALCKTLVAGNINKTENSFPDRTHQYKETEDDVIMLCEIHRENL